MTAKFYHDSAGPLRCAIARLTLGRHDAPMNDLASVEAKTRVAKAITAIERKTSAEIVT